MYVLSSGAHENKSTAIKSLDSMQEFGTNYQCIAHKASTPVHNLAQPLTLLAILLQLPFANLASDESLNDSSPFSLCQSAIVTCLLYPLYS